MPSIKTKKQKKQKNGKMVIELSSIGVDIPLVTLADHSRPRGQSHSTIISLLLTRFLTLTSFLLSILFFITKCSNLCFSPHSRGPQGGAFDKEINYFRTVLGSHTIIPGLEYALRSMKVGGIRQIIVPYGSLSYPSNTDFEHDVVGPKPTTFSGMRALNFVLENERVDRTLLFNVKLVRVDRSDGRGGFIRGGGPI